MAQYYNSQQKTINSVVSNNADKSDNKKLSDKSKKYIDSQSRNLLNENHKNVGLIPQNIDRIRHQDIIQESEYNVSPLSKMTNSAHEQYHNYNPYYDYLQKKGLLKDNFNTKIKTSYLNIDSSCRISTPTLITDNEKTLDNNPLSFSQTTVNIGISTITQNLLSIYYPNHNFQTRDKIILNGIETKSVTVNTNFNFGAYNGFTIVFTPNSYSLIIITNFDTMGPSPMSFYPNFSIGNGILQSTLSQYDTSNMFVTLSGFNVSPNDGNPFIGNIPINFLNGTHRVYFTNPDYTISNGVKIYSNDLLINPHSNAGSIPKITGFYILLPSRYIGTQPTNNMIVNMTFHYYGGIPLNELNAEFPIDIYHKKGYHLVYSVDSDHINILIGNLPYYLSQNNSQNAGTQISFGGTNVYISKIINIISGFSSPNNYNIILQKPILNVISARLVNSVFPNTLYSISNDPSSKNNRLYWTNQDDGDVIYQVDIPEGNYDSQSLANTIQEQVNTIPRQYSNSQNTSTTYTKLNYMTVSINTNTNIVSFSAFKRALLQKPIVGTQPEITDTSDQVGTYIMTIFQSNHGLSVGNIVSLSGAIDTFGIPASVLNSDHTIIDIPNQNTYTFEITNFNLSSNRSNTGGGFGCSSIVPIKFSLLFNYSDTIGSILGFRNVGNENSITKYDITLTNNGAYQNEIIIPKNGLNYILDQSGNEIILKGNALTFSGEYITKFNGYDYILMVIDEFPNFVNISKSGIIRTFFSKINMSGQLGSMLYDTFISNKAPLYDPINITDLTVGFYNSDGSLVDFNNIEHSYILEISSFEYTPKETGTVSDNNIF